jgi:hypothetical protein
MRNENEVKDENEIKGKMEKLRRLDTSAYLVHISICSE